MEIKQIHDAAILAKLNKPLQDMHVQLYPNIYKPYDEAVTTAYFADCLADESYLHFGAYINDQPMGLIQMQIIDKPENAFGYANTSIHVHQLAVDATYHRSGAGRALMERVKQEAALRGISRIDLTVRDMNEQAIAFYKSIGFTFDLFRMFIELG